MLGTVCCLCCRSDVAGRLSLGSVGSNTPPLLLPSNEAANNDRKLQSPNETALSESLGILDLDAMEGELLFIHPQSFIL